MGVEALQVISDHEDAIAKLAAGLRSLSNRTVSLEAAMKSRELVSDNHAQTLVDISHRCQERWDVSADTHRRAFVAISGLRDRGFLGRLKWLLTGR